MDKERIHEQMQHYYSHYHMHSNSHEVINNKEQLGFFVGKR